MRKQRAVGTLERRMWQMDMIVNRDGLTEEEYLSQYRPGDYERPSVTADILIFSPAADMGSLKILLIKRGNHPFINQWALPGGFVNIDESAYSAACRELKEETGLENVYMEQLYTFSQPDRDPRMRVIDIAYLALINESDVYAGDDAADAAWFTFELDVSSERMVLENRDRRIRLEYSLKQKEFTNGKLTYENYVPERLSETGLAFDHAEIVMEGCLRLRNKIMYTDIAFNLVPDEFTLPDLQKIYELVLGKQLYKKSFRTQVEDRLLALGRKGKSVTGAKASELYRYSGTKISEPEQI